MLDKQKLIQSVINWQKSHKPTTGYAENAIRTVCGADLPEGTNILIQFALQFDGKETATDYIHWDKPEIRLPYSNTYRYSLDQSADCSSFWWTIYKIFFNIDIGNRTLAMYDKWHKKFIPFKDIREGDLILYDFKGRNASHVVGYIGNDQILHTTNPTDKMHINTASTYAVKNRVGVFRPLSDEQYKSLLIVKENNEIMINKDSDSKLIAAFQTDLINTGNGGKMKLSLVGQWGTNTEDAIKEFQRTMKLPVTGVVDAWTMQKMSDLKVAKSTEPLQTQITTLTKQVTTYTNEKAATIKWLGECPLK
jgi:peptidoglycan hydrolase-like protein with peptidoglycan-binding domain